MKHSLQMKIGQQLAMTPQLQQAIKLLQLSTLELQTEIQQALDNNPMLELQEDDGSSTEDSAESEAIKMRSENEKESKAEEAASNDPEHEVEMVANEALDDLSSTMELSDAAPDIPDELPVDSAWEDIYEPAYGASQMQAGDDKQRNA